jgi:hypothetical protein
MHSPLIHAKYKASKPVRSPPPPTLLSRIKEMNPFPSRSKFSFQILTSSCETHPKTYTAISLYYLIPPSKVVTAAMPIKS